MRISDWSSDVCSSDLNTPVSETSPTSGIRGQCFRRGRRYARTQDARGRGGLYTNGDAKARRTGRRALNPNFTASAVSGPRGWDHIYDIDAEAIRQIGRAHV